MTAFSRPRKLEETDDLSAFECGVEIVDAWARKRSHGAMAQGTAVVYLVECAGEPAGFYSLSAHSIVRDDVKGGWLRRNTPEHIPVVLLGMLGVDRRFQGQGLGWSLLRDAILRAQDVSETIGARALVVEPASEEAAAFYGHFGFRSLPGSSKLFLPLR